MTTTVSSNAKVPQAEGYELRIGTKHYRLAASRQDQLVLTSKDSLAERADDKGSTGTRLRFRLRLPWPPRTLAGIGTRSR
jgi:hypothetical protein